METYRRDPKLIALDLIKETGIDSTKKSVRELAESDKYPKSKDYWSKVMEAVNEIEAAFVSNKPDPTH